MVVLSIGFALHMAHVDASLLKERPKLPMQRDQPLADKLVLIPILLLTFVRDGLHGS